MARFSLIFTGSLLLSSPGLSNVLIDKNLISCVPSAGVGGFITSCKIESDLPLLPAQDVDSDFYVDYRLSCDRKYSKPMPSKLVVSVSGSPATVLNYKHTESSVHIGSGFGPLVLTDLLPAELANRNYANGCELIFTEIKAVPSAKVRAVWQEQYNSNTALLKSKQDLVRSLQTIVLLLPAYELFQSLINTLEIDLTKESAIVESAKKLAICTDGTQDCDLLYKMTLNETLKPTEMMLIGSLRTLLSELPTRTTPLVLKERMSEQSIKLLEKLAKDAEYYQDAKTQIDDANAEILDLESAIAVLQKNLGVN